jgi:hypothetical protein
MKPLLIPKKFRTVAFELLVYHGYKCEKTEFGLNVSERNRAADLLYYHNIPMLVDE